MQNLKLLTDDELLDATDNVVQEERNHLSVILAHLREVERRRLFCGNPSLFAYCTNRLKYSPDQAMRRISAMRLVREIPEVEDTIVSGEVNISLLSKAQNLFSTEKKQGRPFTSEEKAEVIQNLAGLSVREAEKVLVSYAPEKSPEPDRVKPVGENRNRATVELTDEVLAKIEKLKGWLSHVDPNMSMNDLLDRVCDIAIEELDPAKEPTRKTKADSDAAVSRMIWARDKGACTECGTTHLVQEDHRVPESMGGEYTVENMRLLCRSCNQRAAIEKLGQEKMDPYLSPWTTKAEDSTVRERWVKYCA